MAVYKPTKKGVASKVWYIKFECKGIKVRRSSGTEKKREALAMERVWKKQIADDHLKQQLGEPPSVTFGDAMERWLDSGAPVSMLSHARNVDKFLRTTPLHLAHQAANDMKKTLIRENKSPCTINRRLAVVKRVLNLAHKQWDWLALPTAQKIGMVSEKGTARDVILSHEQAERLIAAIHDTTAMQVTALASVSGLRKSEILALCADDWKPPHITVKKSKNGKSRTVPLITSAHHLMEGVPFNITEHHLRAAFEAARTQCGMDHVRFHDLRHCFASWMADDPETPLAVIRDLLGHSSLAMTSRYMQTSGDALRHVERAIGTKSGTTVDHGKLH